MISLCDKKTPSLSLHQVDIIGVGCYSTKELWTWEKESISLAAEKTDKSI